MFIRRIDVDEHQLGSIDDRRDRPEDTTPDVTTPATDAPTTTEPLPEPAAVLAAGADIRAANGMFFDGQDRL